MVIGQLPQRLTTITILSSHTDQGANPGTYLIFVIFFTRAKFLENKIYTEKTRKLRQNTQKIANFFA